jgi:hypothetical protein
MHRATRQVALRPCCPAPAPLTARGKDCVANPPNITRGRPPGSSPGSRPTNAPASAAEKTQQGFSSALRLASEPAPEAYCISDLPESIASRITVHPVSGCWIVGGYHDPDGYARIRGRGAHRVIWEALVGAVPDKLVLDHRDDWGCLSKACGWPAHLLPVTNQENCTRDGVHGVGAVNAAKTRCDSGHSFDLYNTYFRPDGHRDCRACIRRRVAEYQRRQREKAPRGQVLAADLRRAA